MGKLAIKLVIFDLSNVCFSSEEPPFIRDFCLKHSLDENKFDRDYQELLNKSEVNEISGTDVWRNVLEKYNIKEEPGEIISEMMKGKYAFKETLEIAKSLKEKGYKVVFLTNYNKDYWDHIKKRWDMKEYFSDGIVSYEIKARKPAALGFKTLMSRSNVKPEETLFIDDSEGNLENAKKLGIKTHQFKNAEDLKIFIEENIK